MQFFGIVECWPHVFSFTLLKRLWVIQTFVSLLPLSCLSCDIGVK